MGCGASHDGDASSVHADPGTPVVKRIVGEERRGSSTSSASSSSASARAKRELSAARDLLDQEPGSEAEPEPEWAQQDQLKGEEAEESEVVQTARVKTAPPKRISATEPPIFFIVGGPGSGKGTQCQKLKEKYNLMHVSTGEILRNEVATGSDLGKTIDLHMRSGSLISTDIVMSLLKKTLDDNPRAEGFLIDGFPRDVQQIELFESQIRPVDLIIYLEAPDEILMERLINRGLTSGRLDDNETSINKRLITFHEHTEPIETAYKRRVHKIDCSGHSDTVFANISSLVAGIMYS